jgi:uncharacterized protein YjbJ (UPF0337 family)
MTSWNRGKENEEIGEQQMNTGDPSQWVEGAGRKIAGEVEQGIDNVGDTIAGKQDDLQGKERNVGAEASEWAENRGEDLDRATDRAGDWVQERGEDIKDATR